MKDIEQAIRYNIKRLDSVQVIEKLKEYEETERDIYRNEQHPSFQVIPYIQKLRKRKNDEKGWMEEIYDQSRETYLDQRAKEVMTVEDLNEVEKLLRDSKGQLTYQRFQELPKVVPPKTKKYFTSMIYLRFTPDEEGNISANMFYKYLCVCLYYEKMELALQCYDTDFTGYLTEGDIENFIYDILPTIPSLSNLPEDFYPFYVFMAARRFSFFLDPRKTGSISLKSILESSTLEDFVEMVACETASSNSVSTNADITSSDTLPPVNEEISSAAMTGTSMVSISNWFSAENSLRIYNHYLELDEDQNGMLSRNELINYGGLNASTKLTKTFVERLFQEIDLYYIDEGESGKSTGKKEGEMDYRKYLDFVLAMENRDTEASLKYFWRVLDMNDQGFLTFFELEYFFREITTILKQSGMEINSNDVIVEIFDMIRPTTTGTITKDDFFRSSIGSVVVSMLIDVNGFLIYENRESLIYEDDDPAAYDEV